MRWLTAIGPGVGCRRRRSGSGSTPPGEGWNPLAIPWGNELRPDGEWRCNIWQRDFPARNTLKDGWLTLAPVHSFEPNGYGLGQTVGNVWEWCSDWYDPSYYRTSPAEDPTGPRDDSAGSLRVLRGGSYFGHDSSCNRYRHSAKSGNTPDSSMGNAGFRTVAL